MTPSIQHPIGASLQKLIEISKQDLARRLSITADEITVVETEAVTWPDSSLCCPQEGMAYAQALTPGYLIRLQAGDTGYEYRAGRGTTVTYCENPSPPVPGTPGDV